MEYLLENNMKALNGDDDDNKIQCLMLSFTRYRTDREGNNSFHIFATNERFLQLYSKRVQAIVDEFDRTDPEMHYFSLVYPNNSGLTPLDFAINQKSSRSIEIMLEMLSRCP